MNFSYIGKQVQSQHQKLILTAEMKESLEILQMTLTELKKKVEEAILENPVLEIDESCQPQDNDFKNHSLNIEGESYEDDAAFLKRAKRLSSDRYAPVFYQTNGNEDYFDPLAALSKKPSFSDYLLEQLSELKISAFATKTCQYIIGNLDEKGYLRYSVDEIAMDLGLPILFVKNALNIVQQMDPAGVGAINLCECLTLQLLRQSNHNPIILEIINQHLELLAENKIKSISQKLHIPIETAQEYCNQIRRLNPIPSSGFNTKTDEIFVIPEAVIKKDNNGSLLIESNDDFIPHLCISSFYLQMAGHTGDKATEKYLKTKITQAASIMQQLCSRKKTITRVLEKTMELQQPFFEK